MYAVLPRVLPPGLDGLTELALDLRWTWNHAVDEVWAQVDAELWEDTHNPWIVLRNAPQRKLEQLSADQTFLQQLKLAMDEREAYLTASSVNASRASPDAPTAIAYFSMEFGLSEALPLYAGGLGVLAGDYLKTASDLGVPLLGISLLYQEGYFRQTIDTGGNQREAYPYADPTSLPIQPAVNADGAWMEVDLPLPGRMLRLRVWHARVGRTRLYLLDSNHVRNGPVDRGITSKLYGGGSEMRLLQEVVLGMGGWALLEALPIDAEVCHLNEGHAALAVLERARRFMHQHNVPFWDAWWATRAGNVFTTHTPVAAGFDAFTPSLIYKYARGFLADCQLSLRDLLALGRADPRDDREPFNMTYLALRGCAQSCAVSRLHGSVSRQLFDCLYPRWPVDEVPVRYVTNGVHVPSWDSAWADTLWTRACGKGRWLGKSDCAPAAIFNCDDATLWGLAADQRLDLVHYARERLAWQWGQRGESAQQVAQASQVLDPNVLTLGLARRFAEYKRMNLLLHDQDRLMRLLLSELHPVQLIIAGKAHPDDELGKQQVRAWLEFTRRPELHGRVVFLEDYDLALAQQLVQGVDVWINTPRRPWEACGTSGMKTLVNGGLNLSVLDGWWAEAYDPAYGWAIDSHGDDAADAACMYRLLEEDIVPAFYTRDANGIPVHWVEHMRASMSQLAPRFSSNRMLLEYLDGFYMPATRAFRRRQAHGARLAQELRAWHVSLSAQWHEVHFGTLEVQHDSDHWRIHVPVYLGDIDVKHVKVELCAEEQGGQPALRIPMQAGTPIAGAIGGYLFMAQVSAARPADHYTPRVRSWHAEAFLPAESTWIAWQR